MSEHSGRPAWAKRERLRDMAWVAENLAAFWPAAREQYGRFGRGAIVVDTTLCPAGRGHPFAYLPQDEVAAHYDSDAGRMVQTYNPELEVVIVLLKPQDRLSAYRIWVLG